MLKKLVLAGCLPIAFLFYQCDSPVSPVEVEGPPTTTTAQTNAVHLLHEVNPMADSGNINAVIEIPAGTMDKWELDKSTGKMHWEKQDGKPRVVNYLGYPGNYGLIPQTLLAKENGGDGDPLDILVLGPPAERGEIMRSKIIGVLYLQDRGEQDDKLIAVSANSPMYGVNSIEELDQDYPGISNIVQLWFTNYKGPGKMESNGYGSTQVAMDLLQQARKEYKLEKAK